MLYDERTQVPPNLDRGAGRRFWCWRSSAAARFFGISQSSPGNCKQQLAAASSPRRARSATETKTRDSTKANGLTPSEIKTLGDATVLHSQSMAALSTGRPIGRSIRKMTNVDGEWLPCYVRMDDGKTCALADARERQGQQLQADRRRPQRQRFRHRRGRLHPHQQTRRRRLDVRNTRTSRTTIGPAARFIHWRSRASGASPRKTSTRFARSTDWVPESGGYMFESEPP